MEYFKIKNFKRFEELELDDLGQFNLITGDNNVGKTSVLEALLVGGVYYDQIFWALHRTLNIRGLELNAKVEYNKEGKITNIKFPEENYLTFLQNDFSKRTTFYLRYAGKGYNNEYWFQSFNRAQMVEKIAKNQAPETLLMTAPLNAKYFVEHKSWGDDASNFTWLHFEELNFRPTNQAENISFSFIPVSQDNAAYLSNKFGELYLRANPTLSKKVDFELAEYMRILIPDIDELRPAGSPSALYVGLKGTDERALLNEFGDGVVRLTRLLFHLYGMQERSRLMIDEIDTGIHHSRMKDFLKCLVKLAEKKNIQLFMTTHSLECQEAFAEVFEDPDMVHLQSEFRNITLVEALDHSIKPFIYNYQQLSENLDLGIETRGRKLA